ncbi:MAG: hypothetical protein IKM34_07615 [Clostridia bacterium]|nr:hypothetical protein [Clostridia bacterium]
MREPVTRILLQNIKVPIDSHEDAALSLARKKLKQAGFLPHKLTLAKKSVDARKRSDIVYICSVMAELEGTPSDAKLAALSAVTMEKSRYEPVIGETPLYHPPVVVGFGPAGMFSALALAEHGYCPVVLERGGSIAEREQDVARFYRERVLSLDSNIQFGAGGAGTFSDGKLVTRKNDSLCAYVLEKLCEFGAPEEILVNAKPHIGTDLLKQVVASVAKRIESLGGIILYHTRAEAFTERSDGVLVKTQHGEIMAGAVILAIGHSARDTYSYLNKTNHALQPKAFSVGVRIEHLAEDIDRAMYGRFAKKLPHAEYTLSYREGERGVYSFCMCPGGTVVAAISEEEAVVTNGMSIHARNGKNSNAALAVSVLPEDYGNNPMQAIAFQRSLEKAAYREALAKGGAAYAAPIATVGDFLSDRVGSAPTRVMPTYMESGFVVPADLNAVLPSFVSSMLKKGIWQFGKKIAGFDAPDALLTAVETRTSAPLRILRGDNGESVSMKRLYPCGEGAGYAGGITSAALDGLKIAAHLMAAYRPTYESTKG